MNDCEYCEQDIQTNTSSKASIPNSSEISTPRQLFSETLDTSTMASGSSRRPGRLVCRWAVRSDRSWELSARRTRWTSGEGRTLLAFVWLSLLGLLSYNSLRGRCRCFWWGSCWVGWYDISGRWTRSTDCKWLTLRTGSGDVRRCCAGLCF
jgi:hypothetical protein